MRLNPILNTVLATAVSLPALAPTAVLAHAGHGDEFAATGAVLPVHVNTELDGQLGVEVQAIAESGAADGSVLIPATAIVTGENDGSANGGGTGEPFVFVQAGGMYKPTAITLGEAEGDAVTVIEGLSLGDEVVTAGTLVLYAESRKAYDAHELEHAAAGGASAKVKRIAKGLIVFAFGALVGGGAVIVATRNPDDEIDLDPSISDDSTQNA